ncbi:hypothetical protein HK097_003422, partial [Rhizophlyctis rosea]
MAGVTPEQMRQVLQVAHNWEPRLSKPWSGANYKVEQYLCSVKLEADVAINNGFIADRDGLVPKLRSTLVPESAAARWWDEHFRKMVKAEEMSWEAAKAAIQKRFEQFGAQPHDYSSLFAVIPTVTESARDYLDWLCQHITLNGLVVDDGVVKVAMMGGLGKVHPKAADFKLRADGRNDPKVPWTSAAVTDLNILARELDEYLFKDSTGFGVAGSGNAVQQETLRVVKALGTQVSAQVAALNAKVDGVETMVKQEVARVKSRSYRHDASLTKTEGDGAEEEDDRWNTPEVFALAMCLLGSSHVRGRSRWRTWSGAGRGYKLEYGGLGGYGGPGQQGYGGGIEFDGFGAQPYYGFTPAPQGYGGYGPPPTQSYGVPPSPYPAGPAAPALPIGTLTPGMQHPARMLFHFRDGQNCWASRLGEREHEIYVSRDGEGSGTADAGPVIQDSLVAGAGTTPAGSIPVMGEGEVDVRIGEIKEKLGLILHELEQAALAKVLTTERLRLMKLMDTIQHGGWSSQQQHGRLWDLQGRVIPRVDATSAELLEWDEWVVHPAVFRFLDQMWGQHTIDLFARAGAAQTVECCSKDATDPKRKTDAFGLVTWETENAWINPPIPQIDRVVDRIARDGATAT